MTDRYSRQTILKDFGPAGQSKLTKGKVLVIGLGGLGLPALQYLNAMGVGTLGLVDQDVVEVHNLQRQVLYSEKDLGKQKLEVALQKLEAQNTETQLIGHDTFLTKENALEIIKDYDMVLDASDNFSTRYLVNDACVMLNKPFVYGALHGFEGHVSVFNHFDGPTYRCLYPNMPSSAEVPNCNENGVLGVVPGIIGTLQALEVVKILTGIGDVLSGKLLLFDGLHQMYSKISFKTNPKNKQIFQLQTSYEPVDCTLVPTVDVETFQYLRESGKKYTLVDVRTKEEFINNNLEEALHFPLNDLGKFEPKTTDTDIYVICQSGKRSEIAVRQLQKSFSDLTFYSILGGMHKMQAVCP